MNTLPSELNYELFYFLSADTVLNMCQVSNAFASICNDDNFWQNKLRYDYSDYFNLKPPEISYKEMYLNLAKDIIRFFPIYYNGQLLTNVWIHKTRTEREVHSIIHQLFEKAIPSETRLIYVYIYVLLKNVPGGHNYTPLLEETDIPIMTFSQKYYDSLWENANGFNIGESKIQMRQPLSSGALPPIILPQRQPINF